MERIPLLPRETVAYPGQTLTVRASTEPEKTLVKACFEGEHPLGLILAEPLPDRHAMALTPDAIGTAGRVVLVKNEAKGALEALVALDRRFRVLGVADVTPYPVVDVEWLTDIQGDPAWWDRLEEAVREHLTPEDADETLQSAEGPVDASFAVAAHVTGPVDLKQRLLAADSAVERLGIVHAVFNLDGDATLPVAV